MAIIISTGTGIDIASTYGTVSNMTLITNAAEAVATLAVGHGVVVGDILEITSGWARLNSRLARAKAVSTNDVTLEGINTTSTTLFPAGQGTGSVRRITAWTEITQISDMSMSGGEMQFVDITSLADVVAREAPTLRSAVKLSLTVMDDPTLAWYAPVLAAMQSQAVTGLRMRLPSGARVLGNGYWNLQTTPNVAKNAPVTARLDVSYVSDASRASS